MKRNIFVIVIPSELREEILNRIHDGHLGISKYRARARESVWWPGLSSEIENLVSKCHKCIQHQQYFKESLLPSAFPNRPQQMVVTDLLKARFLCKGGLYSATYTLILLMKRLLRRKVAKQYSLEGRQKKLFCSLNLFNVVIASMRMQYKDAETIEIGRRISKFLAGAANWDLNQP